MDGSPLTPPNATDNPKPGAPSEHEWEAREVSPPVLRALKLLSRLNDDQFITLRKDVVTELLALREADARIAEFDLLKKERPIDPCYWDMHHRAALTEARDKLAKK